MRWQLTYFSWAKPVPVGWSLRAEPEGWMPTAGFWQRPKSSVDLMAPSFCLGFDEGVSDRGFLALSFVMIPGLVFYFSGLFWGCETCKCYCVLDRQVWEFQTLSCHCDLACHYGRATFSRSVPWNHWSRNHNSESVNSCFEKDTAHFLPLTINRWFALSFWRMWKVLDLHFCLAWWLICVVCRQCPCQIN